jgi:hypothetical protein
VQYPYTPSTGSLGDNPYTASELCT